jgi:hypothetical protein
MYNVYHFRGNLVGSFDTDEAAKAYIESQPIPTDYYREYKENDNV